MNGETKQDNDAAFEKYFKQTMELLSEENIENVSGGTNEGIHTVKICPRCQWRNNCAIRCYACGADISAVKWTDT